MAIKIFFCYAHEDEALLNTLKKHLRPLQRQSLIDMWYDRDISAGTEWEHEITEQINNADIILLLISPDFMDSDYCYGTEMKRALERHEQHTTRVIPVILRPTYWQGVLGKLQAIPKNAIPIVNQSWHSQDDAFHDVEESIRTIVEELEKKQRPSPQKTKEQWIDEGNTLYNEQHYNKAIADHTQTISPNPTLPDKINLTVPQQLPTISQKTKEQWVSEGHAHIDTGQYMEAIESYDKALQLDPKYTYAYHNRGNTYTYLQQYDKAIADYNEAIKINPEAGLYYSRGNMYKALQQYDKAIADYTQTLQLEPLFVSALYGRGDAYQALQQYNKAIADYNKAIKGNPKDHGFLNRALAYMGLGLLQEAIVDYDKLLKRNPKHSPAYGCRGLAYFYLQQYEKAVEDYDQALKLDPSNNAIQEQRQKAYRLIQEKK